MDNLPSPLDVVSNGQLPDIISTIKQLILDNIINDLIVNDWILLNNTNNQILQKLYLADYQYSKELQHLIVDINQIHIAYISNLDHEVLMRCLTDEEFIKTYTYVYKLIVTEHFTNNPLLMNKWLRYVKNIQEL